MWHKLFLETSVTGIAAGLDRVDGYFPKNSCLLHPVVGKAAYYLSKQRKKRNAGPRFNTIYFKFLAPFLRPLPSLAVFTFVPGKHRVRARHLLFLRMGAAHTYVSGC